MAKKILRQAMTVSPNRLREIADNLESEAYHNNDIRVDWAEQKFLVSIINKQPKCSDTWEFE